MSAHRILVPFDFTRVSDIALQHAKVLGKALGSELVLAHIVPEKKEIPEARLRLQALVERAVRIPPIDEGNPSPASDARLSADNQAAERGATRPVERLSRLSLPSRRFARRSAPENGAAG